MQLFCSRRVIVTAILLFSASIAAPMAAQDKSKSDTLVVENVTIHSMSDKGTFVGSIVIEDGKIKSVGESVKAPEDAQTIDLKGHHAVPGFIESRGKLWLTPTAVREVSARAELNIVDGINPWSEDWKELASQGITSVYVQPGSSSTLGGYGAVLRVGPHGDVESIVMKEKAAIQAAVGLTGRASKDRYAQVTALGKLLESAKKELEKVKKEEEAQAKKDKAKKADSKTKKAETKKGTDKKEVDKKNGDENDKKEADKKDKEGDKKESAKKSEEKKDAKDDKKSSSSKFKPTTDPTKIALMKVLKKEIPLNVEVHHAGVLSRLLKLAKKYEIRLVLDGLSNVDSCCEELAEAGFPAVVGPLYEGGTPPSYRRNADFDWLSESTKKLPLWSLSGFSNSARQSRMLRIQAAHAIQHGVERADALAAITTNAARMLGVSDHVGTIEEGKQADIAIFGGDPLDPSTPAVLVLSHGKKIFERQAVSISDSSKEDDTVENAKPDQLPEELPKHFAIKTSRMLKNGKFVDGVLVVKDGKIVASGKKSKTGDAVVYDLQDTVVTPGLVAASSTLGQAASIVDQTESDASHLRAVDAVDPSTKSAKKILDGGFVHIGVSPGSSNTSAGCVGHLRLGAINYVANPTIASRFNLTNSARNTNRFPASLNGQISMLSEVLDGKPLQSNIYVTSAVNRSINKEKVQNIHNLRSGETKAVIAANTKLEIRSAVLMAKKNKIETSIRTSGQVGDLAKDLAAQKIGLIIPSVNGTEYDTQFEQIAEAVEAGCPVAFEGETSIAIRTTAAMLVAAGVDKKVVLDGLTGAGAEMVGMEKTGLTRGAPADFVVWTDSPINLSAKPVNVVVDGQIVSKK